MLPSGKCVEKRPPKHGTVPRSWVIHDGVTQKDFHKFGHSDVKFCGGPGTEKHRLYVCKGWHKGRMSMEEDVRSYETDCSE